MATATTPSVGANVSELLSRAEQLPPRDFAAFFANLLALRAGQRKASFALAANEAALLRSINREFSPKKMARFFALDQRRHDELLTPEEHRELLKLTQQLEKHDAERVQKIGQLALLRDVSMDEMMAQLGFVAHG